MIRVVLLAAMSILFGCATAPSTSQTEITAKVRATFPGRVAELFWVPSPGIFYDTGRISRLAIDPANVNSSLLKLLQSSRDAPVLLVVSGASSTLARHEIVAALSQVEGDVSKLELSFFGDGKDASEVQRAVEGRGGKYVAAK